MSTPVIAVVAGMPVAAALRLARASLPALEARILLCHVLDCLPVWLVAHDDHLLTAAQAADYVRLLTRRLAGEPVAYLTGEREFFGRTFRVGPGVLIPRHDTEILVEEALRHLQAWPSPPARLPVIDLGTGSGAIAISLALECPQAEVVAVDVSPAALAIAQGNAERLNAPITCCQSHWFDQVPATASFALIVSNPPYIAAADPHLAQGDLRHEPLTALASGEDGLDDIRHIVAQAPARLWPRGWLLIEHGYDQSEAVQALFRAAGLTAVATVPDLAGIPRVTVGQRA